MLIKTDYQTAHNSGSNMTYQKRYLHLQNIFDTTKSVINDTDNNIDIYNIPFVSESGKLLPGVDYYKCEQHDVEFTEKLDFRNTEAYHSYPNFLKHNDIDIIENREFCYTVFKKAETDKADGIILLFHGLNEKYWDKYLPWAEKLVELTGKAVVLFPIAFHMNRVPAEWSNPRTMNDVTGIRRKNSPLIVNSTFANAAISARIEMIPQRFFWSGLQTFFDVVKLVREIKTGKNQLIKSDASINLFAYSIGSFLSEILLMANPYNFFESSRLFIFCGGPTLDRMSPNSRFILDSDATIAIYSFYTERLESELKHDQRMNHYFNERHPAGMYFRAMLSYQKNKETREKRFREISQRIRAFALKKDTVIPANEVLNTLNGDYRDIPVKVDILDFDFEYSHITPFPSAKVNPDEVDKEFNKVFTAAGDFIGSV